MPIPDYDNLLVGQYIRAIENPDSIGYNNGRWYQSTRRGDDPNNRGFGVDVRYNDKAKKLTDDRSGRWLTEQEERNLRNQHIEYSEGILDKWTPKVLAVPPSEAKKAMATGMIYRGDGIKSIIRNPELRDAFYGGSDEDFQKAVNEYYRSKNLNERAKNHTSFMDTHHSENIMKPVWKNLGYEFSSGGFLYHPKDAWDALSMREKAEMMRVAVRNGITSLQEIRQKYNEFAEGGDTNPYSVGALVDGIYATNPGEEFLGEPDHHYNFTQSEEWANAHGYYPDARGHRDDRVKKASPSKPSFQRFLGW